MTDDESRPSVPKSLPNYLADGMPKQDDATLRDIREFAEALLEYRQQAVEPDKLPDTAEPVDESAGEARSSKRRLPVETLVAIVRTLTENCTDRTSTDITTRTANYGVSISENLLRIQISRRRKWSPYLM